jgi:hypothetical protein
MVIRLLPHAGKGMLSAPAAFVSIIRREYANLPTSRARAPMLHTLPAARKSYGERYVKSKIAKFAGRHQSRPIEFRWNQILAWISEIGLEFFF